MAVGFVGGLLGLALGSLRLPFLLLLGFSVPVAAGTNLAVSTLSSVGGSYRHLRSGRVNLRAVVGVGVPSLIGAFIGGYLGGFVHEGSLLLLVSLLLGFLGFTTVRRLWWSRHGRGAGRESGQARGQDVSQSHRIPLGGVLGLLIGLLGGAVGLILGILRLPVLLQGVRLPLYTAIGTNITVGIIMGTFGFVGHALRGEADYWLVLFMGSAAVVGSYVGAQATGKTRPEVLEVFIGLIYCSTAIALFREAVLQFTRT